jgi:hypothetical protein
LAGNPIALARAKFAPWIDIFEQSPQTTQIYDDLDFKNFQRWANPADPLSHKESDAILILSHHDNNGLYFDQDVMIISPGNMTRLFSFPSLAIINACGTANPGAFEFVREFNLHGVDSIVASSIEVDARLGGKFASTLADMLDRGSTDANYKLDQAVFDAIKDLSGQSDEYDPDPHPYGPRALIFSVIGNGNLRVCVPHKAQ